MVLIKKMLGKQLVCLTLCRRIQLRRLHIAFMLVMWCAVVVVFYFSVYGSQFNKTLRVKYTRRVGNYSSACRLPNLDPFHPSILEFVTDLGKLQCTGERYSTFKDNVLEVKGDGIASVQYRTLERRPGDDFKVVLSDPSNVWNLVLPTLQPKHATATLTPVRNLCFLFFFIIQ